MYKKEESLTTELRWRLGGSDTWQIFWSKLEGELAAGKCLKCLVRPRPEPLLPGQGITITQRNKREEDIEKWDEWDEKAFGLISKAMLDSNEAQLIIAQIPRDAVGCGRHAATLATALHQQFELIDNRTESNRRDELWDLKIKPGEACIDFMSQFTNLRSRLLQVNPTAITEQQSIIRLCDALTNQDDATLLPMVQNINGFLFMNPNLGFEGICQYVRQFDSSKAGKERISSTGIVSVVTKCFKCRKFGHKANECPTSSIPGSLRVNLSGGSEGSFAQPGMKQCSHCNKTGHVAQDCFGLHPEKLNEFRRGRQQKRKAFKSAISAMMKGMKKSGEDSESEEQNTGQGFKIQKPPSFFQKK